MELDRNALEALKATLEKATKGELTVTTDGPGDVVIWGPEEDWLANVGNWARQREMVGDIDPNAAARQYVEMRDAADAAAIVALHNAAPSLISMAMRALEYKEALQLIAAEDWWPPTNAMGCCLECGRWNPALHPEAHGHEDDCKAEAMFNMRRDRKGIARAALARKP